jgi:hypothetical protein
LVRRRSKQKTVVVQATAAGLKLVPGTKGVYLRGDDITSIEFIQPPPAEEPLP